MPEPTVLAIGTVLVAGIAALAWAGADALRMRRRMKRRIERMDALGEWADTDETPAPDTRPGGVAEPAQPLVAMLDRRYPLAGGIRTSALALAAGVLAGVALAPSLEFVGVPLGLAMVATLLLAAALALNLGSFLEQRQRLRFSNRFLVVLEEFQRMVRYGMAAGQAFKAITANAEAPVRNSLNRVLLDTDFGVPLAAALEREARRVRISEMAMLAAIFSTQSRTGGGLAESVGNLAEMQRERIDNLSRVKAATSEPKITLVILTLVPFAAVGIQAASQPALVSTLLDDARHLLGIGAGLIVTGLTVAYFLVRGTQ